MNKNKLMPILFFVLFLLPAVLALEFDDDIDPDDKETFDINLYQERKGKK